jgi:hypothetical protein
MVFFRVYGHVWGLLGVQAGVFFSLFVWFAENLANSCSYGMRAMIWGVFPKVRYTTTGIQKEGGVCLSMKKKSGISLMSPAMSARKARVDALLSSVRVFRQRRRELVPRFAVEWGLSREMVQEYVGLLLAAGRIQEGKDGCLELVGRTSRLKGKSAK